MNVRIGIIGTGFARRVQLPALQLVPGVTLYLPGVDIEI